MAKNIHTLIHRAQTGDEEAYAALMREYYPFRICNCYQNREKFP